LLQGIVRSRGCRIVYRLVQQRLLSVQLALQLVQDLPEREIVLPSHDLARGHPISDLDQQLLELRALWKTYVQLFDCRQRP
jgi:hypothetical protein